MAEPAKAPPTPPGPAPDPQQYQAYAQYGRLMSVIGADPRYRDKLLGLIDEAVPNAEQVIPELAWKHRLDTQLGEQTKGFEARAQAAEAKLGQIEHRLARREFLEQQGLSEDDAAEIEELAKKGRIGDAGTAVDYWRKTQLGQPRSTQQAYGLTPDDTKELYKDPKGWYFKHAPKILDQVRRATRRGA